MPVKTYPDPRIKRRSRVDVIERYLIETPGSNSLSLFRTVYGNDSEGDLWHQRWVRQEGSPTPVIDYCEAQLSAKTLNMLADRRQMELPF